ncbi:ChaN family lipoprotein [Lunatimonas salinarum]|uniref:ChaN family lipoprotein n=1 Tax=Lunatimonas salinarum TaxID=1774590 RepID=UPI001FD85991|nr:ChaN family lipoprotein [Lunatimonas salinarum]
MITKLVPFDRDFSDKNYQTPKGGPHKMSGSRFWVCLASCFTLFFGAEAQEPWIQHAKLYLVSEGREATLSEVVNVLDRVDVVFFGEQHNDSITHTIQHALYDAMIKAYGDATLSLEMFERDAQLVLDEYVQGHITEAKLKAEGKAWPNYADYAPLVNLAVESGQHVVAANVPTRYANLVSRKGLSALQALPKASRSWIVRLPLDTLRPAYQRKFDEAMGGHGHGMGPSVFHAQLLRDATMAESIWHTWKKDRKTRILHLNGRFHSDYRLGTAEELSRLNKRIKVFTISAFPADDYDDPDWATYKGIADLIILTDPVRSGD